jgi:hypothetical protein
MDMASIPSTVYVAFGVITAALLTGVFSIMNMVSAKENKVSEFRLAWVDGLRNEIAEYTSAAQELSRAYKPERFKPLASHSEIESHKLKIELYKETREAYARAAENLTKIQLRLNPVQIEKEPKSHEAQLMAAVLRARKIGSHEFSEVLQICNEIRLAAAPILKSTWRSVKRGEPAYRRFRIIAILTVLIGFNSVVGAGVYIGVSIYKSNEEKAQKEIELRAIEAERRVQKSVEGAAKESTK